jgi:hypothetical protein
VCDIPVAKQNFRQRHGHGLIDTLTTRKVNKVIINDIHILNSSLRNLPELEEKELQCFFEWIQKDGNVF